ncbi:MAG: hypothetical protein J7K64_00130, partial [Bacteroidales bacterium]|nr:hypothetical protein [Bacteroidales bacterium]
MKKLLITTAILAFSIGAFAQEVPYYKWSDHMTFMLSNQPIITGYGMYSDSLSKVFSGKTFYEYNNEYYPIESWADYYRWYILEYFWFFDEPALYEYFYIKKNDLEMAKYVSGNKYK